MTGDFVFFWPEGRIFPWVSDPGDQVPGPHRPAVLSATSRWQPRPAMLLQFPPSAGCGHHKNTGDTDSVGPGSCGTHRRTHLCTRHMNMHAHTDSWRSLPGNQLPEHPGPSRTEGILSRTLALGSPFRRGDPLCSSSPFPSLISFLRCPQASTSQ